MAGTKGHSGGARVGSGPRPKTDAERWLTGNAGRRKPLVDVGGGKPVSFAPLPPVAPPDKLTAPERAVWELEAPHALAGRTLTTATAADFYMLCVLEVECADVLRERRAEGWTTRGMFLAKEFRGLAQRVEAKRRAFKLAPMGKDMVAPEAPKDEWSEFDAVPQ